MLFPEPGLLDGRRRQRVDQRERRQNSFLDRLRSPVQHLEIGGRHHVAGSHDTGAALVAE
jgi:hypothetical protein